MNEFQPLGHSGFTTGALPVPDILLSTDQACVGVHLLNIPVQQSPLGGEKSLSPVLLLLDTCDVPLVV